MVTLRALKMRLMSQDPKPPPCSCLEPLSALTQLHSLDLNLEECAGSLPPSLLPRLQHLTHLGLRLQFRRVHLLALVSWCCGSPGAPRLRSLTLSNACLAPEEATLNSLGQLESLRLQGHCAVPVALRTLLHSLTGLTSLELHDDVWRNDFNGAEGLEADEESESDWCLGLLAGCSQLRRLELYYEALISRGVPPGSLQHLSYLSLDDPYMMELHMAASWACLPSLESLRLAGWVGEGNVWAAACQLGLQLVSGSCCKRTLTTSWSLPALGNDRQVACSEGPLAVADHAGDNWSGWNHQVLQHTAIWESNVLHAPQRVALQLQGTQQRPGWP